MEWVKLGKPKGAKIMCVWLPSVRKDEPVAAVERKEPRLGEKETGPGSVEVCGALCIESFKMRTRLGTGGRRKQFGEE